jgi:hypothetical protein
MTHHFFDLNLATKEVVSDKDLSKAPAHRTHAGTTQQICVVVAQS